MLWVPSSLVIKHLRSCWKCLDFESHLLHNKPHFIGGDFSESYFNVKFVAFPCSNYGSLIHNGNGHWSIRNKLSLMILGSLVLEWVLWAKAPIRESGTDLRIEHAKVCARRKYYVRSPDIALRLDSNKKKSIFVSSAPCGTLGTYSFFYWSQCYVRTMRVILCRSQDSKTMIRNIP